MVAFFAFPFSQSLERAPRLLLQHFQERDQPSNWNFPIIPFIPQHFGGQIHSQGNEISRFLGEEFFYFPSFFFCGEGNFPLPKISGGAPSSEFHGWGLLNKLGMDFAERIPAQRGLGLGFHWDAGNNRLPQGKSDLDVSNI